MAEMSRILSIMARTGKNVQIRPEISLNQACMINWKTVENR